MFINNNIIVFENIFIDFKKQKIIIRNCDIIIFLKIRLKIVRVQIRFVHVKKNCFIFTNLINRRYQRF